MGARGARFDDFSNEEVEVDGEFFNIASDSIARACDVLMVGINNVFMNAIIESLPQRGLVIINRNPFEKGVERARETGISETRSRKSFVAIDIHKIYLNLF